MANSGAAQNKLGELFVDIVVGGLGKTLKALNSVSASFLLTKNAAQQAIKPFINFSKQGRALVTQFDKINSVTGLSIDQLQRLRQWAKLSNVDFGGFVNQIQNMQQSLLRIRLGEQGLGGGWTLLGIDPNKLDYTKPEEALNILRKRIQQVDEATGAMALTMLGFSPDLLYAWRQQNTEIDKSLLLTQAETEELRKQQAGWNKLGVTWEAATNKLLANLPIVQKSLNYIDRTIKNIYQYIDSHQQVIDVLIKPFAWLAHKIGDYARWADKRGQEISDYKVITEGKSNLKGGVDKFSDFEQIKKQAEKAYTKKLINKKAKETYQPLSQQTTINNLLSPLPKTNGIGANTIMNDHSKEYQVVVTQNIYGQNAIETAAEAERRFNQAFNLAEQQNQSSR